MALYMLLAVLLSPLLTQSQTAVTVKEGFRFRVVRVVFEETAMGFVPDTPDEVVRVRTTPTWLRIDARFGSVYRRRGDPAVVLH